MNGRPTSKRYRKFAPEYVSAGFNGTQAVLSLGWTENEASAAVIAHRLLRNVKTQELITYHIMKAKLTADQVIENLSEIAETPAEIDGNQRLKALELLGKFHKLFVDKLETTDTSQQNATESALLKSIEQASLRDSIPPQDAAISLFSALQDDPQFADVNLWPAQYREQIRQSQQNEQITEIGDQ